MKKTKTPTPVITAALTLITIMFWAGFEVFRTLTVKPEPTVPQPIIRPLDPTLDINTLQSIGQRTFLTDDQIGNAQPVVPTVAPSATPAVTATPVASGSATPVATSSASPSSTP
ncbi:MAG TPA: hypothetical protein VLE44_02050 [Candidatus Saccharimonadales bacterium]|nr:hypothetical protein [Candidatus Saccharimonadales bacterium]